jgi:hypothetical protein
MSPRRTVRPTPPRFRPPGKADRLRFAPQQPSLLHTRLRGDVMPKDRQDGIERDLEQERERLKQAERQAEESVGDAERLAERVEELEHDAERLLKKARDLRDRGTSPSSAPRGSEPPPPDQ